MQPLLEKYKALTSRQQIGTAIGIFIALLILLPNTIVYASAVYVSSKLINGKVWKNVAIGSFSLITFFSLILLIPDEVPEQETNTQVTRHQAITEPETNISTSTATTTLTDTIQASTTTETETVEEIPEDTPTEIPQPTEPVVENTQPEENQGPTEPEMTNDTNLYQVVKVVDGDTVKLNINGQAESIRLIGLDTPETVHPSKPVECMGIEASNKAKELLTGQTVRLEADDTQGTRDKYGRLLGYVFLPDGRNFNQVMIEQGYAHEYTYSTAYKYQSAFKSAEQSARDLGLGLWAEGVCDEEEIPEETTEPVADTSTGSWYVSGHYSSKFYYCEESDGWQSLSEKYLEVYGSESALLAEYPNHTLHESCQ